LSGRVLPRLDSAFQLGQIESAHVIPHQPGRMILADQAVQIHRLQLDLITNGLPHARLAFRLILRRRRGFRQSFEQTRLSHCFDPPQTNRWTRESSPWLHRNEIGRCFAKAHTLSR
jgi:hypothetical protein